MIRVLHVLGTLHIGDTESRIMDFYRKVDKERPQFVLLVFPSRYGGMSGAVLEVQTAGLKCLISDQISDNMMITGLVKQKSIKEGKKDVFV